jgi:hypothetical protein
MPLADRAEPRDHTTRRVNPNLAGIEHSAAENVAILDRAGTDDLGCGSSRANASRLRRCSITRVPKFV